MRSPFFFFLFFLCLSRVAAQVTLDWELYHPVQKQWLKFGQAGTVQEFLWKTGELPDPFYGENEAQYQWIEQEQWVFRSMFFLEEKFFNAKTLVLDIPNLDTYAQIYLNGKLLAKTANFFVHYQLEIEVTSLNCGYNQLEIRIESGCSEQLDVRVHDPRQVIVYATKH